VQFIGIDHPAMDQSIVARGIIDEDAAIVFLANDKMNCHGQIITIAELGFEIGSETVVHPAFKGRPKKIIANGCPIYDKDGHGTHVAGCAVADGGSVKGASIKVTAPAAVFVMQISGRKDPSIAPKTGYEFFQKAIGEGSWVQDNFCAPEEPKEEYELQPTDIDRALFGNKEFVAVVGSGNGGEKGWKVSQCAGSKNTITIGGNLSTRAYNCHYNYDDKGTPGNPDCVADCSSEGLGYDSRFKSDIVAPGLAILSAASRDPANQNGLGIEGKTPKIDDWEKRRTIATATPLESACTRLLYLAAFQRSGIL